jgi:hypothetical protein
MAKSKVLPKVGIPVSSTITSDQWKAVRRFVEQVRLHAHETVVDKSIIQDIFDVVDAHGMEIVESMIQHEQRLFSAFSILRVEEGGSHGLQK